MCEVEEACQILVLPHQHLNNAAPFSQNMALSLIVVFVKVNASK
nr:MAG TPA: hypothetical protein [Caudoviricetes sp.]